MVAKRENTLAKGLMLPVKKPPIKAMLARSAVIERAKKRSLLFVDRRKELYVPYDSSCVDRCDWFLLLSVFRGAEVFLYVVMPWPFPSPYVGDILCIFLDFFRI